MKKKNSISFKFMLRTWSLFFCCISMLCFSSYANSNGYLQQKDSLIVRGTVTAEKDGIPLPGVTVLEKGTNNGTVTDFDGNYKINIRDAHAILEYSSVGFQTKEMEINNQSVVDISLQEGTFLDEVTIVGYGSERRENVTGAVSSVKTSDIVTTGANTLTKSIQGRIPGVEVESSGGGSRFWG